jgi:hypothetical protein
MLSVNLLDSFFVLLPHLRDLGQTNFRESSLYFDKNDPPNRAGFTLYLSHRYLTGYH